MRAERRSTPTWKFQFLTSRAISPSHMSTTAKPIPTKASEIPGNATDEQKEACLHAMLLFKSVDDVFAHSISQRVRIVEVSAEPFGKGERVKTVCELTVETGMFDLPHLLHIFKH